ncbi:MAG: hypothetical protein OIF57_06690 [Marinobacterium sp.]|nr:hypothetical protein [Marinobacterium sp.]
MGWKTVKDKYRIKHNVCLTKKGICIGSGYVHDFIVINPKTGVIEKPYDGRHNDDLKRYMSEMTADPAALWIAVLATDQFEVSLPVYTYDGADIVLKYCEQYGWPNVTHDGCMMYENRYSKDRETVALWAKKSAQAGISSLTMLLERTEQAAASIRRDLQEQEEHLQRLNTEYPESEAKTVSMRIYDSDECLGKQLRVYDKG